MQCQCSKVVRHTQSPGACLVFSFGKCSDFLPSDWRRKVNLTPHWMTESNNALWQCSAMRIFCDFCQQVHAVDGEGGGIADEMKS